MFFCTGSMSETFDSSAIGLLSCLSANLAAVNGDLLMNVGSLANVTAGFPPLALHVWLLTTSESMLTLYDPYFKCLGSRFSN